MSPVGPSRPCLSEQSTPATAGEGERYLVWTGTGKLLPSMRPEQWSWYPVSFYHHGGTGHDVMVKAELSFAVEPGLPPLHYA